MSVICYSFQSKSDRFLTKWCQQHHSFKVITNRSLRITVVFNGSSGEQARSVKLHCTFGKGNKITKHKDRIAFMMRPHQDGGRGRGPGVSYSTNVWPKYPVSL